jgi:Domain of unknown function (DUF4382)
VCEAKVTLPVDHGKASVSHVRKATLRAPCWIQLNSFCIFLVLVTVLFAESCSGLSKSAESGTDQVNNAAMVLTLRAAPMSAAANVNLLSFRTTVASISLTPATGGSVNVGLNSEPYQVDLTRLQSDSTLLAISNSIPNGTYTNMVVSLSDSSVTYCVQTHGGSGCEQGSISTLSGVPVTPVITASPFPLTVSQGQAIGLAITIDIGKALTVNGQTQAITEINLGAANVLTAVSLPPASSSLSPGTLDFVEDVTGIVSSVNQPAQSVTIQTATKGSLTVVADPQTIVSPNCLAFNLGSTFSCVSQGQVASLDTVVKMDGSLTLLEYDPLAVQEGDWVEGLIDMPPSSSTQFQLVTNDFVAASNGSVIASSLKLGDPIRITLTNPKPFVVDSKGLVTASSTLSGSTDASVLSPGETLAVHVVSFTPATDTAIAAASVDFVYLRFTRVTGAVANSAPPNSLTIQSLPPFFGLTLPVTVQLSTVSPSTNFDGVGGASELVPGQAASIRALFFGPPTGPTPTSSPFTAAKVRTQ